jgi:23S rRNA (cytidine1920-2'-O)/16S rRNA (cytidine1409-2'-O)-methyltransferase
MIMDGKIFIDNIKVLKNSEMYNSNVKVISKNFNPDWVSRGAIKLLHALDYFNIDVTDLKCLDLGASTGGFTEVLLSRHASKIYSVDVGTNQLHEKLKNNVRIINIPNTNARYLSRQIFPDFLDIIVCDVSFISMKKVIEPSLIFLEKKFGIIVGLIKPQFESEKKEIKRGVIRDPNIHERICNDYRDWFIKVCKMKVIGIIPSPIKGASGNIEFLICAKRGL